MKAILTFTLSFTAVQVLNVVYVSVHGSPGCVTALAWAGLVSMLLGSKAVLRCYLTERRWRGFDA